MCLWLWNDDDGDDDDDEEEDGEDDASNSPQFLHISYNSLVTNSKLLLLISPIVWNSGSGGNTSLKVELSPTKNSLLPSLIMPGVNPESKVG